jgi:hypothetical protein
MRGTWGRRIARSLRARRTEGTLVTRVDMLDCNVPVRRKQNRRLVSAQPLASRIWGMVVIRTCRAKSGRIIAPMTQARTASSGVVTPPPLQHWLHAVLMLFVELVQGVATTLGMIFNRTRRDWHTADAREDLPQAKSDIHLKEANTTHGVILGLVPRISVRSAGGIAEVPSRRATEILGSRLRLARE